MVLSRVFVIFVALMTLASCNDSGNHPAATNASTPVSVAAPARTPKKIALVMKTLTNPFFIEMEKGARKAEKEFGIELLVKTGSQETAIEQQIQIIDELIQSKVDAIVVAPGDSQRLVPILKKAQSSGIAIINIDNQLDQSVLKSEQMQPIPFVSVDNEAASYQSAKFVADQIKKPSKAAIIEGIRGAENARLRMVGAERAFSENSNIHVVAKETANWKIDEAHDVTKRLFASHPDITVLFCANDMMALGALRYLQESKRKDVLVAGYDALDEAKTAIKQGAMASTIDQQAAEQGYQGVALAVRALKGEKLPPTVMVEAHLVTADLLK
jgi:ribose transport system substrate-binding protein